MSFPAWHAGYFYYRPYVTILCGEICALNKFNSLSLIFNNTFGSLRGPLFCIHNFVKKSVTYYILDAAIFIEEAKTLDTPDLTFLQLKSQSSYYHKNECNV